MRFRKKYNKSRVFCVYPIDKSEYNKTIERNRSGRFHNENKEKST